jgi:peptidoglycan/LPS O-acetylase OafA/YrhL
MMDTPRRVGTGHVPALDGLRAFAILLVLAHNFDILAGRLSAPARGLELALDAGWIGVQLFFVLSGYLITGGLLDTRGAGNYFGTFFGRRLVRIFPLYYVVLLVGAVIVPLALRQALPEHQVWLWTYTSNWAQPGGRVVDTFPHFWSLAVEEQFYLVWPFVVRLLPPRKLVVASLALGVVALAARIWFVNTSDSPERAYMFTVCRMDALCFGAAIAGLVRDPVWLERVRKYGGAAGWAALALAVVGAIVTHGFPRISPLGQTLGYSLLTIIFGLLLVLAITRGAEERGPLRAILGARALGEIGKYSYAIYIFHQPLHVFVGKPLLARLGVGVDGTTNPLVALAYVGLASVASVALGFVSFHVLEKHFLKLKKHFVPSKITPPPAVREAAA